MDTNQKLQESFNFKRHIQTRTREEEGFYLFLWAVQAEQTSFQSAKDASLEQIWTQQSHSAADQNKRIKTL